jgi:hypothetical protein
MKYKLRIPWKDWSHRGGTVATAAQIEAATGVSVACVIMHRLHHGAPYGTVERFERWLASWNAHEAKLKEERAEIRRIRNRGKARKRRVMRAGCNAPEKRKAWYWKNVETERARARKNKRKRDALKRAAKLAGR